MLQKQTNRMSKNDKEVDNGSENGTWEAPVPMWKNMPFHPTPHTFPTNDKTYYHQLRKNRIFLLFKHFGLIYYYYFNLPLIFNLVFEFFFCIFRFSFNVHSSTKVSFFPVKYRSSFNI